jgi:hypothetical protein
MVCCYGHTLVYIKFCTYMAQGNFLTFLRKLSLFLLLVFVATGSYLSKQRATDWEDTLWVTIYPINGDGSQASADYIRNLSNEPFIAMEDFMASEGTRYALPLEKPLHIFIGQPIDEQPPLPPTNGSWLDIVSWSLKLRYWARQASSEQDGPTPDTRIFLRYFDPQTSPALGHSIGLQEGMIGIVNGYANRRQEGSNNFVIPHEVMHTLGATDKYGPNNQPIFPEGYAEPELRPTHPQLYAELMGGRIPLSTKDAEMPDSLKQTRIGSATAREIAWFD